MYTHTDLDVVPVIGPHLSLLVPLMIRTVAPSQRLSVPDPSSIIFTE